MLLPILVSAGLFMSDFIEKGSSIQKLPQLFQFTEGPVWTRRQTLLFTDIPASRIYEWDGKKVSVFREDTHNANGLTLDKSGSLFMCQHGSRSVSVLTPMVNSRFGHPSLVAKSSIARTILRFITPAL
jgi:sugar lactone lactonase YvrE